MKHKLRPVGLTILSAITLGLSQPLYMYPMINTGPWPYAFGLLALIGYAPLFLVQKDTSLKGCFGWSFFSLTCQFTVTLYWIYIALHIHGHISPIPASIVTLLLPMILALMVSVFFTIAKFISIHFKISFLYLAPVALCAGDYFRNYFLFGGFPWGNMGYSLGRVPEFLQLASWFGVYGLVFFVGLINALLAFGFRSEKTQQKLAAAFAIVFLLSSSFIYGHLRISQGSIEYAQTVRVGLLQGNIPQEIKSSARLHAKQIIEIYEDLQEQALAQEAELIIWPESAYPRPVDQAHHELETKVVGASRIIGASTYSFDDEGNFSHYQNSSIMLNRSGAFLARYDKSHLVPFGEYVPWPMVNIVDKVVPGMGAFKPGDNFKPVNVELSLGKTLPVGTTICYEGIFPEIGRAYANNGAKLLVNITNDAWYDRSSAPFQHLLMYQLRAVESGRPYVRATNSGVSAWVDAFGTLNQDLGLFERGLIVANVPLINKETLYLIVGDIVPIFCMLLLGFSLVWILFPAKKLWHEGRWLDLGVASTLILSIFATYYCFNLDKYYGDESAKTKALFLIILALTTLGCFLSKSLLSKKLMNIVGTLVIFISLILAYFESYYFAFGVLLGLAYYLLAFSFKNGKENL